MWLNTKIGIPTFTQSIHRIPSCKPHVYDEMISQFVWYGHFCGLWSDTLFLKLHYTYRLCTNSNKHETRLVRTCSATIRQNAHSSCRNYRGISNIEGKISSLGWIFFISSISFWQRMTSHFVFVHPLHFDRFPFHLRVFIIRSQLSFPFPSFCATNKTNK